MSSTQAVTGSDSRHPPVAVKLSEQEQKRVQQADGKLQDFMHQAQEAVKGGEQAPTATTQREGHL